MLTAAFTWLIFGTRHPIFFLRIVGDRRKRAGMVTGHITVT